MIGTTKPLRRYFPELKDYYVTDIRNSRSYLGTVRAATDADACSAARDRWYFCGTVTPRSVFCEAQYQEARDVERARMESWMADAKKELGVKL